MGNRTPIFWLFDRFLTDTTPTRIALGVAFGILLGLNPVATLQWWILLGVVISLRLNLLGLFVGILGGVVSYYILLPLLHPLGYWALSRGEPVHSLWTWMYHAPVFPFTRFNHTTVMGSALFSLATLPPIFFVLNWVLEKHSQSVLNFLHSTRTWDRWVSSITYRLYGKYRQRRN